MNPSTELSQLLRRHQPTVAQAGYPNWLRARIGAHVRRRHRDGTSYEALAGELGVTRTTLAAWARMAQDPAHRGEADHPVGGFAEVVVRPEPPTPRPTPAQPAGDATLCLVSPQGFGLRGITMEQARSVLECRRSRSSSDRVDTRGARLGEAHPNRPPKGQFQPV